MPIDRNSLPRSPAAEAGDGPLSELERARLAKLLARAGVSEQEATAQRERECALEAKRAELMAKEERMAARLRKLQLDVDEVSEKLDEFSSSGPAKRHLAAKLQRLPALVASQSFFGTAHDCVDAEMVALLAEIGIAAYERAAIPGRLGLPSLRTRMASVGDFKIGPGGPQASGREAIASEILRQGRLRRGEEK